MQPIRELFDPARGIDRTIEKVITFGASQESRLQAEISEYIVTTSIEEQFRKLLDKMQLAMQEGGANEIGVWVSGFYGSGKSSFAKYLGLALDERVTVGGVPFLKHLQDRFTTKQVQAQLTTIAHRFPAAVVMVDLATNSMAGAAMEDVATVLYYNVLQWAGYSRNLKVAALERRLEKDGRLDEFCHKIEAELPGLTWKELQNDPLVVDDLVPRIAHELYPALFSTPEAFSTRAEGFMTSETDQVTQMLEIVREKSGKQYVVFVVDEVGQYVGARDELILKLDGLAKNLKLIGDGKAWILATAQQTLTEDSAQAALNSPKLYKLKDRFPIQVDLESSDIKEICYRRLLGKSPAGEATLGGLFDTHGQALRQNTRLENAKYYDADFDRQTFVNLYPFLPAHFSILLHLLGALAKSTGGVGLRSAIKVIQDILIERDGGGRVAVADQPVGWLATTVTLYDALENDIRRAFFSVHHAVHTTCIRFPDAPLHQAVAKSVAVLQIVGNLPVTVQNLAGLMHPAVAGASLRSDLETAVADLRADKHVPLGEKDGSLCFLSERLRDIEQERGDLPLRTMDVRRVFNEALRGGFDPLPRVPLSGGRTVTSGLKVQLAGGGPQSALAGEKETIQTVVELAEATGYDGARTRLVSESIATGGKKTIYLLGRASADADRLSEEIYRCQRIAELHRNDPDAEVRDYCNSQLEHAAKLQQQLQQALKTALSQGSFVFQGQATAVGTLHTDLLEAAKKQLGNAAEQVFAHYHEAPQQAEAALAEKFLRTSLNAITSSLDPLGLVTKVGGQYRIRTDHPAAVRIHDFLNRNGTVDGKRLLEHFSEDPYGWSKDTVRYLLSALLVGGDLKLKISGREVTTAGQQAIDALKTNTSFNSVSVALRDERIAPEVAARAAERLTKLTGEDVIPLEQDISKAALKHFPGFQNAYAPLAEKLEGLGLAGAERVRALARTLQDVLSTDASDAPQRLGAEDSALYESLVWAGAVKRALNQGLDATLRELQEHRRAIEGLPRTGVVGELRTDLSEDLDRLAQRLAADDFHEHAADLNTLRTAVVTKVRDAAEQLATQQAGRLIQERLDLAHLPEWRELTNEEQNQVLAQTESLAPTPAVFSLKTLQDLLNREIEIGGTLVEVKQAIRQKAELRHAEREAERLAAVQQAARTREAPPKVRKTIAVPKAVKSRADLDTLIDLLTALRDECTYASDIDIEITFAE